MAVEIRPIKEDEMEQFLHVASTSLVMASTSFVGMSPEFTLCAFEDGKLATSYAAWPLTMRFNGVAAPVAGVTSVGTLPVYRRRGYLRQVATTHFNLLHERGEQAIAILQASQAAIYQRYGYGIVSTQHIYNVEPRSLKFSQPHPVTGTFREVNDDEFPLLVDLYRRFRADRTGYLHRAKLMWEAGVMAPPPPGAQLNRVVYQEAGEPLGYVIYIVQPEPELGPGSVHRLAIRDFIWLTASAYRALWSYFANMDLVGNIVWRRIPSDDPLPHLLLEPRMLRMTSSDDLLGRIVDVERALPLRHYDEEGSLTFEIVGDDLCPWNCGKWQLEVTGDSSSVSRDRKEPQLVMPISTLALILFGQISATQAARMARLESNDESALSMWDRIMRTRYRPACADRF
jgi:predicted acetyltransferase